MAKKRRKTNQKAAATTKQSPATKVASPTVVGSAITPYTDPARNDFQGIEAINLADYERALRVEPIFAAALSYLVLSMLASLGEYTHPDTRIQAFNRKMIREMEGNLHQSIGELMHSAFWSGKGVSEMLIRAREGRWWLRGLVNYHPASIKLVPNKRGVLTDGKRDVPRNATYSRTGVYQYLGTNLDTKTGTDLAPPGHVRIPLQKTVIVRHGARFNNLHGQSLLAPAWLFYEMKWETLKSWMITSEKYGAPTLAVVIPHGITSNFVSDGKGGLRPESSAEAAVKTVANMTSSSGMVFEIPPGQDANSVKVIPVTTGNNFGSSYKETVDTLDYQMFMALGLPPLLFLQNSSGFGGGEISQTQADNFKQKLISFYKEIVEPFTEQIFGRLNRWNFGSDDPGYFPFKPFDPGAAQRLMQTTEMALNNGLIDVSQSEDLQHARTVIGWAPADGQLLESLLKGNKKLMESIRNPDKVKLDAARTAANAVVEAKEIEVEAKADIASKDRRSKEKIASMKPEPSPLTPGSGKSTKSKKGDK